MFEQTVERHSTARPGTKMKREWLMPPLSGVDPVADTPVKLSILKT